jgi:hypothetical protein
MPASAEQTPVVEKKKAKKEKDDDDIIEVKYHAAQLRDNGSDLAKAMQPRGKDGLCVFRQAVEDLEKLLGEEPSPRKRTRTSASADETSSDAATAPRVNLPRDMKNQRKPPVYQPTEFGKKKKRAR